MRCPATPRCSVVSCPAASPDGVDITAFVAPRKQGRSDGRLEGQNAGYLAIRCEGPCADGSRKQMKRRGFATKKAAIDAEAEVLADQARGTFVRPARVTLSSFLLDEWLPAKTPTLKPSTAASYDQIVRAYIVPRLGDLALGKVDGSTLNAFYGELLTQGRTGRSGCSGGLSAKSVRNVHGVLHRALLDAVRWRRLMVNPCDAAVSPAVQRRRCKCGVPVSSAGSSPRPKASVLEEYGGCL